MVNGFIALIIAYLLGSIPAAYIVTRLATGKDIRQLGGGNVGARNVFREVGRGAGIAVGIFDVGKGAAAVAIAHWLLDAPELFVLGAGLVRGLAWAGPLLARTKRSVLESLVEIAGRTWQIWEPATVLQAVREREEVLSTGFENGVAIPHPRNPLPDAIGESVIAYGRTLSGIPFGAPKRALSDVFFLVVCRDSRTHLQVLARLGRMIHSPGFLDNLREAETSGASYDFICAADELVGGE